MTALTWGRVVAVAATVELVLSGCVTTNQVENEKRLLKIRTAIIEAEIEALPGNVG